MAVERPLSERERELLEHLLSGHDQLSVALRDRVERAVVLQDTPGWASIHLWAGEENLQALTGGSPMRAVAAWREGPTQVVSLTIAGSGDFSHLLSTHETDDSLAQEFPPAEELDPPRWEPV